MCCAKGDANSEKAGSVLEDVTEEVDRLIRGSRYGFPGIELYRDGEIKNDTMAQGDQLEELLQRLERDLEDHMNLKFDELEKRSERIASKSNLRSGLLTLYKVNRVLGAEKINCHRHSKFKL